MPEELSEIWAIVEQRDGRVESASREIVSEASRPLRSVSVFVWGAGAQDSANRTWLARRDAGRCDWREQYRAHASANLGRYRRPRVERRIA